MKTNFRILGWSEAIPNYVSTGTAHLQIVNDGSNQAQIGCGTKTYVSGQVAKEPRSGVRKCKLCERIESRLIAATKQEG